MTPTLTLHTSDEPRVSVLVLCMRDPGMLERCLRALATHVPPSIPFEVLLLCNGATPDVVEFARRRLTGVRVDVSAVNLGFGGGNNRLARQARGEFLVLLNDDAEVEPGWLEALVETADAHPEAAAVGSRLLFADGTVQEAGSVIFADGSTAPVGRGLPAGSAEMGFVRRVDYTSAASLLIRRTVFEEVGGFDPRYFPAYYEDTDLCLALEAAGQVVLYDGRSRVRHHESASTVVRFKHFLFERNVAQLRAKWADALSARLPRPPDPPGGLPVSMLRPAIERARGNPPRVLVVDDMLPLPGLGAGFGRMYDLAVEAGLSRYSLALHVTKHPGADPMQVAELGYEVVTGDLRTHLADPSVRYDVVLLCRPSNFDSFADLVRQLQPDAALVYMAEALFHTRLAREAALYPGTERGAGLLAEARASRELEESTVRRADLVVGVSAEEMDQLRAAVPSGCPVEVVEPLAVGIAPTPGSLEGRRDLLFVPAWTARGDTPNEDGFRWFVAEVLPLVTNECPWTRLRVTGANPPEEFLAMAGPHLEFTGYVEDLASVYATAKVVVIPMRFGAGVKNKTVEALQYGVPVVTTTVGAEGIDVAGRAILVADDPAAFAAEVVTLLRDPTAWHARRTDIDAVHAAWEARRATRTSWVTVLEDARRERSRRVAVRPGA